MRFALKLELPPFSGVGDCPQSPWVSGSSLRALVRRTGGLPSPGKILFAALSPHRRRAHLAARIRRRAPSAGALNPLHPGGSRPGSGARWTCDLDVAPYSRGSRGTGSTAAGPDPRWKTGTAGTASGQSAQPWSPSAPRPRGQNGKRGERGGRGPVEAPGLLAGGDPRSGLPAQTFQGELLKRSQTPGGHS